MASIFDQLDDGNEREMAWLSPLDVADLPHDQRQIMLSFFRDAKRSAGTLTLTALQAHHSDIEDIEQILSELTKDNWLIKLGESSEISEPRYKVNLRRRLTRKSKSDIWTSITDRLSDDDDTSSSSESPSSSLPSLSDW